VVDRSHIHLPPRLLRSRTVSGATSASVSSVTYSGNTVTGANNYGVVIQQDYLNGGPTGKPTNGVSISDINFTGTNTVSAASGGQEVYVLCGESQSVASHTSNSHDISGSGSCKGTWDWSGLKVSGGSKGSITGQ
jgi:polygalacturonase